MMNEPSGRRSVRFGEMPRPARWAVVTGGAGAAAGLVVGLVVHPPTAAFAAVELGIPSAILGGMAGAVAVLATRVSRRNK